LKQSRFNEEAAFPEIREALLKFGIEIGVTTADQAAARIQGRPEAVRRSLIAAFDECLLPLALMKGDPQTRQWLRAARAAADNDAWRVRVRTAIFDTDWRTLEQLAREADVPEQPPSFLLIVARVLPVEMRSTRLELSRQIQRAYPADLWANHHLAQELLQTDQPAEAIRYLTAALALRPDNPGIYLNRGNAQKTVGEVDAAITDYRRCLALAPQYAAAHASLGGALVDEGRCDEAMAECQKAVELDPNLALAWCHRGLVYAHLHQYEKALADYSEAIKLDPKLALAWDNRGRLYVGIHQYEKGLADFSEAIKLDPKRAAYWSGRGNAYLQLHQYEKAVADCTEAIKLDPKRVYAWFVRGGAYAFLHQYDEALADCNKAVELGPKVAEAHYNLGCVLSQLGQKVKAIPLYEEAIKLKPEYAEAHCNLALALRQQGEFRKSLAALRRGDEIGRRNPGWPYPSIEWVKECERQVELDEKLPGFLEGRITPASPAELIELAGVCIFKRLNRAAALFFGKGFDAEPKLAEDLRAPHRYNAACAAALAGCGQGTDADKLDDKERARLRRQALDWLQADLKARRALLDQKPDSASVAASVLQRWLEDPDFTGVRGSGAIAKLPEAERQPWQKLWNDVSDMLKRAQGKAAPEKR
jgi:tetratricopeptide (TPR) repeat protein